MEFSSLYFMPVTRLLASCFDLTSCDPSNKMNRGVVVLRDAIQESENINGLLVELALSDP